jgi:deazaflavin-dependent oxidoreductase (nitroreductase family)
MSAVVEQMQQAVFRTHQWLYEKSDGRVGRRLGNLETLLLRSTGRRSGSERVNALVFAMDGDGRYVVVGSDGGNDRSPGWVHNVRADPEVEIQVGRQRHDARATILVPGDDDYARLWTLVNDNNRYKGGGRYAYYQTLTDRPIPLVVLSTT